MTQLFAIIKGPKLSLQKMLKYRCFIDGLELRLDTFDTIDLCELKDFVENCPLPVMFTLRPKEQGGEYAGAETTRLNTLEKLASLHPAFLDLESIVPSSFRRHLFKSYPYIQFLNSYHNFKETPSNLDALYEKIYTPDAHFTKIALKANTTIDAVRLLLFLKKSPSSVIGISMGEKGQFTRILSPCFGSPLAYAPLDKKEKILGQLDVKELQTLYRFSHLNEKTHLFALIGDPVEKSLGHFFHNQAFSKASLNAVYVKVPVQKEELALFVSSLSSLSFSGLSVTMPHKEEILSLIDDAHAAVFEMKACNTLIKEKDRFYGFNTDGKAALNVLEKRQKIAGKHILILGAGGVARAIAYEAVQKKAKITLVNRTAERANKLARELDCRGGGWELFSNLIQEKIDIIINCIPEKIKLPSKLFSLQPLVMDTVYQPRWTSFLKQASFHKCQVIHGEEMFVAQAQLQQSLWSKHLN